MNSSASQIVLKYIARPFIYIGMSILLSHCSGGSSGHSTVVPPATSPSPSSTASLPPINPFLTLSFSGFYGNTIATIPVATAPRQLAMLPNGDLIVGTGGGTNSSSNVVMIVPNAEGDSSVGTPKVFATLSDASCDSGTLIDSTQGVAFSPSTGGGTIFVGRECGVYAIAYHTGDQSETSAAIQQLFMIRQGPIVNPTTDGDTHHTTSVAVAGNVLYTSVGSSCNACTEQDPTRAVIMRSDLRGNGLTVIAKRIRNAVALAVNPVTGTLWAGGAGQDCLVTSGGTIVPPPFCASQDDTYLNGHPYEFLDPVTTHSAPADYMWPGCEENQVQYLAGYNCSQMVVGSVRAPAYSTILGAAIYPKYSGFAPKYAFPTMYQGALFFTMHGSWHEDASGTPVAVPEVAMVPLSGDAPVTAMDWTNGGNVYSTWAKLGGNTVPFLSGFQLGQTRYGRPIGVTVGNLGSLFISDDSAGLIYRIRFSSP